MASLISAAIDAILGSSPIFLVKDELTGRVIWKDLKIKDVSIDAASATTSNPIQSASATESSTLVSLTAVDIGTIKIIQPTQLRLTAFANSLSAIESIITTFGDTKATVSVTTKGITAIGLTPVAVEIRQDPGMMSASRVFIDFEQVAMPTLPTAFAPAQSADASAVSSYGVAVQPVTNLPNGITSIYNKITNIIKG